MSANANWQEGDRELREEVKRLRDQLDEAVQIIRDLIAMPIVGTVEEHEARAFAFLAARSTQPTGEKED